MLTNSYYLIATFPALLILSTELLELELDELLELLLALVYLGCEPFLILGFTFCFYPGGLSVFGFFNILL
jgi:hypothetical protein